MEWARRNPKTFSFLSTLSLTALASFIGSWAGLVRGTGLAYFEWEAKGLALATFLSAAAVLVTVALISEHTLRQNRIKIIGIITVLFAALVFACLFFKGQAIAADGEAEVRVWRDQYWFYTFVAMVTVFVTLVSTVLRVVVQRDQPQPTPHQGSRPT